MQEGSKKTSGQAEKDKKTTTAKAAKTAAKTEVKAEPVKKEETAKKAETAEKAEPVKKTESKKETSKKEAPKKAQTTAVSEAAPKAAKKSTAKAKKAAKEPVVPELVLQFEDNGAQEANLGDVVAKIKAAYVAEGHRESSIKALRVYIKPQDWKAYYVINNKIEGQIDLF